MAVTQRDPNTIHLFGKYSGLNYLVAGEAITPGHLIELYSDSGTLKWRKNSSASNKVDKAVALEQPDQNLGVDDAYAAGDLVQAAVFREGFGFWGLIASGQDITNGDHLGSAGDGTVKEVSAVAATNIALFKAMDSPGSVTALTRVRVMFV